MQRKQKKATSAPQKTKYLRIKETDYQYLVRAHKHELHRVICLRDAIVQLVAADPRALRASMRLMARNALDRDNALIEEYVVACGKSSDPAVDPK